jgi:hypothetical protein
MENSAKLEDLIGRDVIYEHDKFKVMDFKQVGQNSVVKTSKKTMVLKPHEVVYFLDNLDVVTDAQRKKPFALSNEIVGQPNSKQLPTSIKQNLSIYEPTQAQKKVQEALLNMLDKVQNNPEHIQQAHSVCLLANTMVNVERSQIAMMQLAHKLKND